MDYEDFESIKTITNFNEVAKERGSWMHFHWICNSCKLEIIKYCVEHGADFNIKNNYGDTPFTLICFNNPTKEVLKYCLENGADLNIENISGNTPFDYLKKYNPSLVPFVEEWLERKQETNKSKEDNKSKVTIPKVIIGGVIIGGLYKILKR